MITFRDFMEASLYDPKQGFYYRRSPRRDFYTAPELHPAFADILAYEICERLKRTASRSRDRKSPFFVVEMGSGDGTLSRQVLRALKDSHPEWFSRIRYVLVERVETLLLDSVVSMKDVAGRVLGYTRLEDVPRLRGVLFSNELIDAMPVHLLEKRDGRVQEVYVEGGQERLGAFSRRELADAASEVAPLLDEGQRHAVNLESRAWLSAVARVLQAGAVITVDYGRNNALGLPNPPRAFYRHSVNDQLLARPGRQDLTASVDFSDLIARGEKLGMRAAHFSTMGRFLLDRGILQRLPAGQAPADFSERNKIKTLFHPEGMGDVFKVLIQEKDI